MINYYMTKKGKMYACHICGCKSPSIIAVQIKEVEVQFCGDCWKPEYMEMFEKAENVNENVNENEGLPISEKILNN